MKQLNFEPDSTKIKVYCKNNCPPFYKGNYYTIYADYHSIFETCDFLSIKNVNDDLLPIQSTTRYRFRMNHSTQNIEGYIGENEYYFYDYFCDIIEERRLKLKQIKNVTEISSYNCLKLNYI